MHRHRRSQEGGGIPHQWGSRIIAPGRAVFPQGLPCQGNAVAWPRAASPGLHWCRGDRALLLDVGLETRRREGALSGSGVSEGLGTGASLGRGGDLWGSGAGGEGIGAVRLRTAAGGGLRPPAGELRLRWPHVRPRVAWVASLRELLCRGHSTVEQSLQLSDRLLAEDADGVLARTPRPLNRARETRGVVAGAEGLGLGWGWTCRSARRGAGLRPPDPSGSSSELASSSCTIQV